MRDYTIDGKGRSSYVTDFYKASDGTYTVEFADGSVFTKVIACDENLEKLNEMQRKQAEAGIKNYPIIKRNKTKQGIMTAINFISAAGLCVALTQIPGLQEHFADKNFLEVGLGSTIVALLSSYVPFSRFSDSYDTVEELEKIRYVDKYRDVLYSYLGYANALAGLKPSIVSFILSQEDPFSIPNIGEYKLDDLKTIVSNIAREEKIGLTYKKPVQRK